MRLIRFTVALVGLWALAAGVGPADAAYPTPACPAQGGACAFDYQGGPIRWVVTNAASTAPGVSTGIVWQTLCAVSPSRPLCDGNGGGTIGGDSGEGGVDVFVGVTETYPWGTTTEYHYLGGGCRNAMPGCTGEISRPNAPLGAEILCVARDRSAAVCSSGA